LLGFFLDFIEIAVVVVPIVAPILLSNPEANVTAVWLGVMIGLNIQTSFLTPPFGFALFYLRGVAPAVVKTMQIYKGAVAFIALQLTGLLIAGMFPVLINYLPNRTYLTSDTAPPPNNPRLQLCLEEMIFPDYLAGKDTILQAINDVEKVDIGYLPDSYQVKLKESYSQMAKVFNAVSQIDASAKALELYEVEYEPLHREVRGIQSKVRKLSGVAEEYNQEIDQIKYSENVDEVKIDILEKKIIGTEISQKELQKEIPDNWKAARKQYLELAKAEKKSRNAYRRLVDDSYQIVLDTRLTISSVQALNLIKPEIDSLHQVIRDKTIDEAINRIKQTASKLASIKNAHTIKSQLSKARRVLKKKQDKDKAAGYLVKAVQILESEVSWRQQADKDFLPELDKFNTAISNTIGLRMQEKLSEEQAESIAGCLAHHKDISLAF